MDRTDYFNSGDAEADFKALERERDEARAALLDKQEENGRMHHELCKLRLAVLEAVEAYNSEHGSIDAFADKFGDLADAIGWRPRVG